MSHNTNNRLETFCDGVFAIAITLLILEIKIPPLESVHSVNDLWHAIGKLWPSFIAVTFSFIIILISWIGHHNVMKMVDKTSPFFLVANGFFLFTVMVMPFPTAFMAEYLDTPFAQPAIVVYCFNAILHNLGWIVFHLSMKHPHSLLKENADVEEYEKAVVSARFGFVLYTILAVLAFWFPYTAVSLNAATWIYWLILSATVRAEKKQ